MEQLHFWLRSEVKPGEKRTPLLPTGAKTLIDQGHTVTVEKSPDRCVRDEEYAQVGCTLVESGSWIHSPKSAIILGLKELPELPKILIHNHAYFGHSYKNQAGWEENLQRFVDGSGMLWDLEYLTYENGRRVAAFGRSAGFIGMAVGYMVWAHQQLHPDQPMPPLDYHADSDSIINYTAQQLQAAQKVAGRFPRSHVIGALGRCGGGACSFATKVSDKLGVTLDVVKWDLAETQRGGPFPELLQSDIVLNCIYLMGAIPPFITKQTIADSGANRKMTVLVDVSCDTSNPHNPVPVYNECTTFFKPTTRAVEGSHPVDVVSIDHLPSLVPLESSLEFATDLFPHLLAFGNSAVWQNALNVFKQKTSHMSKTLPAKHVWLRCELSPTERRTPLTPTHARQLIDSGFTVTVEKSSQRIFTDSEYTAVGCQLVEGGSWKNAPLSATILGLAELGGDDQIPLLHQHVYFGYCFKEQAGWRELLQRFVEGGGRLLDLEYLTLNSGERAASFSKMAGFIGAAAGLMVWCQQQGQITNSTITETGGNFFSSIQTKLEVSTKLAGYRPNVAIIGAGKVGTGALNFMRKLGLETTLWTRDKTRQADPSNSGQGMPELLEYNIVINAIALNGYTAPFLTNELLQSTHRRTSVVVDVSCDVYNPHNPLPIYQAPTTFQSPARRILDHPANPVDLIAIENLTGLLPRESSTDFSAQLVPHLLYIADTITDTTSTGNTRRTRLTGVWQRAESTFLQKTKILRAPSVTYTPPPSLILPADHPKIERLPHEPIHQNMTNTHHLSSQLSEKIRELAQRLNTDVTHIITSTFQIILSRMCGEEDVMVGVTTTNITPSGLTASLKAARTNVTPTLSYQDFVHKVKITNSALSNIDDPNAILTLVDSPLASLALTLRQFSPLVFSTMVYLPFHPLTQTHIATLAYELFSQFEMTLLVEDANTTNPIKFRISYASHLFDNNRMLEFTHQLDYLLTQAVTNPRDSVHGYSLLTPEASTVVPNPTTPLNSSWPGPIFQHFFQQAKRLPEKVAVISKDAPVTYRQLADVTARLANYIVSKGIKPEQTIAIYGYRNSAMVCAIMGILSAGASYSVIDPAYPTDRIIDLLSVAEPNGWIQIEQTGPAAPQVIEYLNTQLDCKFQLVLPIPEKIESTGLLKDYSNVPPQVTVDGESTAVVTFTSGSTGKPKGVLGRHAPLTGYYDWMSVRFGFKENDHFSMCSGIAHDPLQRDIFTPLYFGASLYIPEQKDIMTPGKLAVWFRESRISVCCLTPAMGQLLSETSELVNIDSLRVALFVGDKLTRRDVFRLRRLAPQVTAVNMWGSTETQRSVSYYIPPPNSRLETMRDILPVGTGMKGCQVIILNSAGKVAGVGEVGELYMRSNFLSRGYKGLPQVNAEKFIQNPFTNTEGDRFYRSGDLGRYLPDGGAEVIGRTDDQVKIRGFRIELGEITTVLSQHPAVKENLIVVREDIPNDKRLVAYVIANKGYLVPPGAELRKYLQNKLPYYMVPSAFVVMKAFPLTPNGKINRAALPAPERVQKDHIDVAAPSEGTSSSPQMNFNEQTFAGLDTVQQSIDQQELTEEERKVATIWADLLGTKFFSPTDSFFEIGGHSLLVSKFLMTLKQTHNLELGVEALFNNPTVQGMAKMIEETQRSKKTTHHTVPLDLNSEVTLPASISSSNVTASALDDVNSVLLTGATGFLGTFLLHFLLEQTKYTVYCLVRATTNDQGLARVKQSLTSNGLWNSTYESRIVIVTGDLAKPVLGLTAEMFTHLAETIDVIVHSGAYVHWVYPYSKLKAINVLSTQELLRLATTFKLKAMHFISSTSVYESTQLQQKTTVSEDDPLSSSEGISNGYGQSKWVADRIVSLARTRGVPCNIYRCGYISGSTTTGVWTTDDYLCRLIKGCVQIQAFPDLQSATCDLLPVDFVAKRIVQIISNGNVGTTFNMCNSAAPTFNQLLQSVANAGYTLQQLPYLEWRTKLQQAVSQADDKNGNALGAVFGMFSTDYPAKLRRPTYQTTNSGITGAELPALDSLMVNYLGYFVRSGFIQAPSNSATMKEQLNFQNLPSALVTRTQRTVA